MCTSEGQFELNENDEICDTGGEHAGQSTASDGEHPTPRDRLRVIDNVHHLLDISLTLLPSRRAKETNSFETSVK